MCHCQVCSGMSSSDPDWSPIRDASGDSLFALAMTIRGLVTVLACTIRDEALLVAVRGLQSHHTKNHTLHRACAENNEHNRTLASMAVRLALVTDPRETPVPGSENLMNEIRQLFDGSLSDRNAPDLEGNTATSSSGICCYRECLKGISIKAAAMRIIHVIPGHIERGAAQYDTVSDSGTSDRNFSTPKSATLTEADSNNPKCEAIHLGKFEIKALATESSTYRKLYFHYKVLFPNGFVTQIQPGLLSDQILKRTGVLTCYRSKRCKQQLAFPCSTVQSGWAVKKSDQGFHYV